MKTLAIVSANLRRLSRNPRNVIVNGISPLLMIFLLGSAFGTSATTHVDVLAPHTWYTNQLLRAIGHQQGLTVRRVESEQAMHSAVEYGDAEAGVVVPADYDHILRSGQYINVRYYAQRGINGQQISQIVQSGIAEESNEVVAARLLKRERGMMFDAAFAHALAFAPKLPMVVVHTVEPNGKRFPKTLTHFTVEAGNELLLFVFLTSLTSAAVLVETRRLGVARRMIASPTPVRSVIFGEALGPLVVACIQALLIVSLSWLLFGVEWGNGLAVAAVTVAFCLVAAGFAMVLGSILETEQQALAAAILFGLSLAALGGSMVPLLFFTPLMNDIAHITPHAWGNEALLTLQRNGGDLLDVLPQVGALVGFALLAFSLAVWRLHHELTH
ncbi:MAG: ABC transporter permease [Solirubrobacterales bacterium]